MELDIPHLIDLTQNNQTDEAVKELNDYFDDLTEAEKGEAYVVLGSAYLQMLAENNEQMVLILESQLEQLKEMEKAEKIALDNIDLAQTREKLK